MRLKSFTAKTMKQAMQMVRDSLGDEAIIVSTHEEKGVGVRVTAALETQVPGFEIGQTDHENDWLQYDAESDNEDAIAEEITDVLLKHAVPADTIDMIVSTALGLELTTPRVALMAALEHMFSFEPLPSKGKSKPIMLLGLPGAGKTLAAAKFATRAVVNDQHVAVVTTDVKRAGGVPQLEAFTKLLGVDLAKVRKPEELKEYLARDEVKKFDQVIIDMPGINPFDAEEMRDVMRYIASVDVLPIMVAQGGMDADEMGEIAKAFSVLGVEHMMPTRLDMARRLGGLLSAAEKGGMAFTQGSHTEAVADGLTELNAEILTNYFMPQTKQEAEYKVKKTTRQGE
ncbi:MAG: GTPase [Micavibrio sp.]|nr:GTPase [Micavibrio sp.]